MHHAGRFALALVLSVGFVGAAVVGTATRADRDELPVAELLRVEPLPSGSLSAVDEQIRFQFEVLGGNRQYTDVDLATRFTSEFADLFTADELNALLASGGPIRFVRVSERRSDFVSALGVDQTGEAGRLEMLFTDDQRIAGLTVFDSGNPRRLSSWESTLIVVAGSALAAAAAGAWRYRSACAAWMLLATSILAVSGVLVHSSSRLAYSAGRATPSLVVVLAVALLLEPKARRATPWALSVALVAAALGAVAPLVRDASLIGHPKVLGAFADNESAYRSLLSTSAAIGAVAMAGVVLANLSAVRRISAPMRPATWAAAAIAAVWAAASTVAAVDYGYGVGTLAAGPMTAARLAALIAVPAVVIFRLVSARWHRPELATLVIDLEGDGSSLQPAIAKALDDPAVQVLTSPDGLVLVDDAGEEVAPGGLAGGRALTRIQSGSRLIGGLVHAAELQDDPARLEAVAAVAGMALQVSRLNDQVTAQLDEVGASRARILEASDTARRRVERDLHDGAQQRLVALGLRLQRVRRLAIAQNEADLAGLLEDATTEVRDTIEEIRTVARGGQPALLAERGLATAVDALAERAPVPVAIAIPAERLPTVAETTAYFVIAEGLTNVAKHAMATHAQVSITRRDGTACVAIRDDGKGGAEIAAGSGLEGLNDRVAAAGGSFTISSGPRGTTLEATIPCV